MDATVRKVSDGVVSPAVPELQLEGLGAEGAGN
ncbi:hypothetical protein ES703_123438 [subsurface metagenome]